MSTISTRYRAYMSGALTDVPDVEALKARYEAMARTCGAAGVTLYLPHQHTDPVKAPKVAPDEVYRLDREQITGADLMLAYVGEKSFGVGMELEMAAAASVPVILIAPKGIKVSRIARGCPAIFREITFTDETDLLDQLAATLKDLCDLLGAPKAAAASHTPRPVLQRLMRRKGFSRKQLAAATGTSVGFLKLFEERPLATSNPGWAWLVRLAEALDTDVADLVADLAPPPPGLLEYARQAGLSQDRQAALRGIAAREGAKLTADDWRRIDEEHRAPAASKRRRQHPGQMSLPL